MNKVYKVPGTKYTFYYCDDQPTKPIKGDVWYNPATNLFYTYNGISVWEAKGANSITYDTIPASTQHNESHNDYDRAMGML